MPTSPTEPPEFFTVAEVAARLRVAKMTVYRLADSGEIESIRVGSLVRIPAAGLHAYLSGARSEAAS